MARQLVGPIFTLPKKPILGGRYAAFIRRHDHRDTDAIVLTYERIQIKVVSSPPDDAPDAITYPPVTTTPDFTAVFRDFKNGGKFSFPDGKFPDGKLFDFDHLDPSQGADISNKNHDLLFPDFRSSLLSRRGMHVLEPKKEHSPSPYVVHGDVIIECGPLVSRDQMVAHLVMQHGGLKAASITIIDGAPRGPPDKDKFSDRPVRMIYVVGNVLRVSGPTQRDRSVLQASVVDLGPSEKQLDKYIAESSAWHNKVLDVIGKNYNVADETLWGERAEHGLVLTPTPHPEYHPYRPGGEFYHPGEPYRPGGESYHPPAYHPVEGIP
jgi:hypothetical protein